MNNADFSRRRALAACGLLALCAACTTTLNSNNEPVVTPTTVKYIPQVDTTMLIPATIPAAGTLIPDSTVKVSPSVSLSLEKIVYWGAYASIAYMIVDPHAPNWQIEEANFPGNHVHMALAMKRYYNGGAGEARALFHRRAKEHMRAGGHLNYEVVEYNESLESAVVGSRRTAFGVIRLMPKPPG